MEFHCRLATPAGRVVEEVVDAESEVRLRHDLTAKGLLVLSVRPKGLAIRGAVPMTRGKRVSTRDFLIFNQELATLLKAGMPLIRSLDILRQRVENPRFRAVLDDIHEQVKGGAALSEAFEAHRDLFPGVYTASLVAGEKSGGLEQVLRRYVAYVRVVNNLKRRTLSALVYPAVLLVLSVFVVGIIVFQVVPAFADFYATFDRELPLSTRIIVGVSTFAVRYWPLVLMAIAGVSVAVWAWGRRPENRVLLDGWILRLPVVGPGVAKFATSQFARTLSTLLGGGIPLVQALGVTAGAVGNRYLAAELAAVGHRVREGEAMASAMAARGSFQDVAIKMVEVGEATGALGEMLSSLGDFYDEEIETTVTRFVALVEPMLLVLMGIIIALLLLALYLPVYQLSATVGR
ncbi:MAG: epsF 1 [Acidobacteria bacterium]|nr:epsF 1 [Acidobacteriota bacterium]